MSDLDETIAAQRNALERLVEWLPGFHGYLDREHRREADKLVRDFGVSRLERLAGDLHEATKRASLDDMGRYGELVNDVEVLRNELRHADRGYAGFFDEVKWDDPSLLDAVYEQDLQLVEAVEALALAAGEAEPDALDALREYVRSLRRRFSDRRNSVLGVITR